MQRKLRIFIPVLFVVAILNSNITYAQCWCSFLTNFSAVPVAPNNNTVLISWRTDTESPNAKDFYIEKSYNGTAWFTIGIVAYRKKGLADTANYSFTDPCRKHPNSSGSNIQYRLKSTNIDGVIRGPGNIISIARGSEASSPSCQSCSSIVITGPNTICSGSATFSIVPSTNSITWTVSNNAIATIQSPITSNIVTVTKTGNGVVTLTATIAGCTTPVTKTITLGPLTLTGINTISSICRGSYIEKTYEPNPIAPGVSYTWSVRNNQTNITNPPTANGSSFVGANTGNRVVVDYFQGIRYTIIATTSNSCGTVANGSPENISLPCTSFSLRTTPNPAKEDILLTIDILNSTLHEKQKNLSYEISLYSQDGVLMSNNIISKNSRSLKINTSKLKPGQYMITVKNGTELVQKGIIIQ